ncbi:hypothetical protein I6U52_05030 [Serratia marcescens]|nr:hypothetical protein [Serratia marcescens]MBH2862621.1 hypothetical protein [Serratia marcescens]
MKTIDIYRAAISDIESFYDPRYGFNVKVDFYDDNGMHPASIIGSNENSKLRFTTDACELEISTDTDFLFGLLIVCHELAHYINRHNHYKTPNHEAHRLIEAWADMMGMKILLLLFTQGNEVNKLLFERKFPTDINYFLITIGNVFSFTAKNLFNNNSLKYHQRIERVMHCAAGVNSFLDSFYNNRSMARSLNVYRKIYTFGGLDWLISSEFNNDNLTKDDFEFLQSIHREIQGKECAITPGLKNEYRKYIDTSFSSSNFELTSNKKSILSEMILREVSEDNNIDNILFLMNEYIQSSLRQSINKCEYIKTLLPPNIKGDTFKGGF